MSEGALAAMEEERRLRKFLPVMQLADAAAEAIEKVCRQYLDGQDIPFYGQPDRVDRPAAEEVLRRIGDGQRELLPREAKALLEVLDAIHGQRMFLERNFAGPSTEGEAKPEFDWEVVDVLRRSFAAFVGRGATEQGDPA